MRPIDADNLMGEFVMKAFTIQDRHGVKLGENWLLDYDDIKDVIDNAPTIEFDIERAYKNIRLLEELNEPEPKSIKYAGAVNILRNMASLIEIHGIREERIMQFREAYELAIDALIEADKRCKE